MATCISNYFFEGNRAQRHGIPAANLPTHFVDRHPPSLQDFVLPIRDGSLAGKTAALCLASEEYAVGQNALFQA